MKGREKMKKIIKGIMISGILITMLGTTSYAADLSLKNMTTAELENLMEAIKEEISKNHKTSSEQMTGVREAVEAYVETEYGEENVEWAWFDYTYTREWDYFTMETHADIKMHDGGTAEYDVFGEVVAVGEEYQVVYVKIGEEEIFNNREEGITDERVLIMLGLLESDVNEVSSDPEETESQTNNEGTTAAMAEKESETENIVVAQRGDKSEKALEVQKMLTRLGYLSGTPDGAFGEKTEIAVKKFQAENGLVEDGIVTQAVYDKLKEVSDAAPEPIEVMDVSAYSLYNEFDNNKIAAKEKYTGKIVRVSGIIESIKESFWGTPYVALKADDWGLTTVDCYFSRDDASLLAGLSSGQSIIIKGTCKEGGTLYVEVEDCSIED